MKYLILMLVLLFSGCTTNNHFEPETGRYAFYPNGQTIVRFDTTKGKAHVLYNGKWILFEELAKIAKQENEHNQLQNLKINPNTR